MPVSMRGHRASYPANVAVERQFFRAHFFAVNGVLLSKFITDGDFLLIGKPRQPHWDSTQIALRIGSNRHDGVRRDGSGFVPPLAEVDSRYGDQEHADEHTDSLHRNCRIVSRYLL